MLPPIRKSNFKRKDFPFETAYKRMICKQIENPFTQITDLLPTHIHATNIEFFLLKIFLFVLSFMIGYNLIYI
jgi:hypothetical protein